MSRLEIHNDVTPEQLALQPGDHVIRTDDRGDEAEFVVKYPPEKLGGDWWVVWLVGVSGCYALCRCRPLSSAPAGDTP